MDTKASVIEATIEEFNEKGLKFTMDDIAKRIGMSKKTIYTLFADKEALFLETVDYCFSAIKESENKILQNPHLDILDKIRQILVVLPERYQSVDWRQVYLAKAKFPKIYAQIEKRLENEWEATIWLLEEGIRQGKIKPIPIPIFKIMVEASIEHFLNSTVLIDHHISYETALNEMISILMDGICTQ